VQSLCHGFYKGWAGLYNPLQSEKIVEVEALVDTRAMYSVVRRDILKELEVEPLMWVK
jgi:hypothetical protein